MSLVAAHREVVGVGDSVDDAIDGLVKKLTTLAAAGWSVDGTIVVDPELAERIPDPPDMGGEGVGHQDDRSPVIHGKVRDSNNNLLYIVGLTSEELNDLHDGEIILATVAGNTVLIVGGTDHASIAEQVRASVHNALGVKGDA